MIRHTKNGRIIFSGVLSAPAILEVDDPNGDLGLIGWPRGARVMMMIDKSYPDFVRKADLIELDALLEEADDEFDEVE